MTQEAIELRDQLVMFLVNEWLTTRSGAGRCLLMGDEGAIAMARRFVPRAKMVVPCRMERSLSSVRAKPVAPVGVAVAR